MSAFGNTRPGDWKCGNCRFMNFAIRRQCMRCSIIKDDQAKVVSTDEYKGSSQQNCHRSSSYKRSGNGGFQKPSRSSSCQRQRKKRDFPIGIKKLQELLEEHPDQIVLQLMTERSGYDILLEHPEDINSFKMCLIMQVLCRAAKTRVNRESFNVLMTKTFNPKFVSYLVKFSVTIFFEDIEQSIVLVYFSNLNVLLDRFSHAMPNLASDIVFALVQGCLMCLKQQSNPLLSELILNYEKTNSFLESEKKKWRDQSEDGTKFRKRTQDHQQPPDNFRDISVIPTAQELNDSAKPFLRRSIVQGKYIDVEHYLDVQFRLLREDFVRPLRNGIQEFRSNTKSCNRDVYIYRNVRIIGADVKSFNLIQNVQLNLPKTFKAENSKRLLYGNLVCFSCDEFKTVFFGSISDRNFDTLKKGIIGIKFDSEISITANKTFIMAESRSYFTSYKHVLRALQKIQEDSFPMEEFIVHVSSNVPFPEYVNNETHYDMQVIRNKNMMKDSECYNPLFEMRRTFVEPNHADIAALRRVFITRDVDHFWPTCEDLEFDESQRRALRNALIGKLSIIQGPPGTGKTFLGLKIAQVLLHNSQHWKRDNDESPILVVCYTNHALDQFLEGMLSFTTSIVRVGSRTKSMDIEEYQINNLVKSLRFRHGMPTEIHQSNAEMLETLKKLEVNVKNWRENLDNLREPSGILKLDCLLNQNVIPHEVALVLKRKYQNLEEYLLDPKCMNSINNWESYDINMQAAGSSKQNTASEFVLDEDVWHDAEDLFGEEENSRKLDNDSEDYHEPRITPECILKYIVTLKGLEDEIHCLNLQKNITSVFGVLQIEGKIIDLKRKYNFLKYGLSIPYDRNRVKTIDRFNISTLDIDERWVLYKHWLFQLEKKLAPKGFELEDEFQRNADAYNEIRNQQYLYVMRKAAVVGMTTTGAAQHTNVLQALQPPIVIIEEAAEILEAHVVTSLTEECQHLIMIGDHQQLQPSATVYELAKHYGLEMSLFERLIKNGVAYETLEYQHRMRPNISRLLVPSIYEDLKDHESVHEYPHIRGMQKDVFFIKHKYLEDKTGDDNSSKENQHEANLIMALCRHLMLQGYKHDDITVLTPYTGQFFLLRKIQRNYEQCQGVRISVVDNFQGEENKIILLSLVRSNEDGAVGFLKTENRICVALSRAKHGLYVTGNMSQLKASCDLWKTICSDLIDDDAIGSSIVLQCENHPEVLNSATTGEDILLKSPEGGCTKPCSAFLPVCGHKCPKICHMSDPEHKTVKCPQPCPKILCERNHPCPQKCWELCKPCHVMLPKTLPCGHTHKVSCSKYNLDHKCPTLVTRQLPNCQHNAQMKCFNDPLTFPCPTPCEIRAPCGHKCTRKCHVLDDPLHQNYKCEQPCPRSPDGCSQEHKCEKLCYEKCGPCIIPISKKAICAHIHEVPCFTPREKIQCNKKCKRLLSCGHHCPRRCKETCGGCTVEVKKIIPDCGHQVEVQCSQPALKGSCNEPCILKLPCGHQCQATCKEQCTSECKVRVASDKKCPKRHPVKVPCYMTNEVTDEDAGFYCLEPCGAALDCEHTCKGNCGRCFHGRLHIACSETCGKTLVCGHICKADCSSVCPPCQAPCPMRCVHSHCAKKCGEPCEPCQEKCSKSCAHQKCSNRCWKKCTQDLCEKPCPKKLKCDHPCVGYCGEPCPPLCRVCNKEELTEIMFGSEDEEDARFVLLEECGHVIEADGLKGWLSQERMEIGMPFCPRCKKPIYNNRRNHEAVLKAYEEVRAVQSEFYKKHPKQVIQEIQDLLRDMTTVKGKEIERIKQRLPKTSSDPVQKIYLSISDSEINLYHFQVQVLKKLQELYSKNYSHKDQLELHVILVKKRVMEQKLRISQQMVDEVRCEIQRLNILPAYWKLVNKVRRCSLPELPAICSQVKHLMDPTVRFDKELEARVREKLKESEKYVGVLGISDQERLSIIQAMGLKQGHWYKCPNGHVYCIGDCGGATVEAKCPECGATIGGGNHTLRQDNAVATEMDGARHSAWSNHYNNMGNYEFQD